MISTGWYNYTHQLFLLIHGCGTLVKSLDQGVMCLRFIFVIVCILNTSWGNVRYADINVKLEPAHLKTKGQFVSTRVNLFLTTM